jgi:putative aldouronate transport system permease protein
MPIIAVMALFFGVGHWNSWFNALIYITDRSLFPLQLVLREILVQQDLSTMPETGMGIDATQAELLRLRQQMAQVIRYGVMIVSTLPIIMIYPFLQKYFVKGVMIGSLKG